MAACAPASLVCVVPASTLRPTLPRVQGAQRFEGPMLDPSRVWLMTCYARTIALGRQWLPAEVVGEPGSSPQEDWRVVQLAFVARITRSAEALAALVPLAARLDAFNVVRNVLEHVACLAWVAADPDARFDVWLKKDYMSRMRHDREVQARQEDLNGEHRPEERLPESDRLAFERLVGRVQGKFPETKDMFEQADAHWLGRYPGEFANARPMSLVDQYTYIYDRYSWMAHPRLLGLQAFWALRGDRVVVHAEEVGEHDHDPLNLGHMIVGQGLLIAAMVAGDDARVRDVVDLLTSNAGLEELARAGRLVVTEDETGTFKMDVRPDEAS
jgi:hypothetical protein